jgi:hypothetical protein
MPEKVRRLAAVVAATVVLLAGALADAAPSPAARCARAKLAALGKMTAATLRCHGRAIAAGASVDQECLTRARDRLASAFQRAEADGGCAATNDLEALEHDVDLFATIALLKLTPPGPTPTPGPSPTPTISPDCADPGHWACCSGYDAPGLGTCSESLVGPPGTQAANSFHSGCTLAGGFSLHTRCPTAICGDPAYCCQYGDCAAGTSGWFGDVSESAIQLVCESATSIDAGACP